MYKGKKDIKIYKHKKDIKIYKYPGRCEPALGGRNTGPPGV